MIAKDYTTDDKIYCYKGSNVLKNKLNLKSYEQLEKAEKFITEISVFVKRKVYQFSIEKYTIILKKINGFLAIPQFL